MLEKESDMQGAKFKLAAATMGWGLLALAGWIAIMALYFTSYNLIEQNAVPVTVGLRDFEVGQWSNGYFYARGSYENESAVLPGDELPLQTNEIKCDRSTNTCTIASADVFDGYLNLNFDAFDIGSWTDNQITFSDDGAICATSSYVIDRASESFTQIVRKKSVIPDYALKSPLHPCDNFKDMKITLADGFKVYWHKKTAYEGRNGIYFHLALVIMNIAYITLLVWLWRKRRRAMIFVADS
jgi:hypothetical protein